MSYTIKEDCTLPSLGKVYDTEINPHISLRSMTTEEEMLRLSHSERPNKVLCDIIEACIVSDKLPIHVYDMCLSDYQYLLHRLRVATYGTDYTMRIVCPFCGSVKDETINLDDLEVKQYTEELDKYFEFTLPVTGNIVKLKLQTPHSIDDISIKVKEDRKKSSDIVDKTLLYTLKDIIKTIDGNVYDALRLENYLRKLPMADTNYILKNAEMLNKELGLSSTILVSCKECDVEYDANFRIGPDFFGPRINFRGETL